MSDKKILVAIPYYNHPKTLRDVVARCLAHHPDVLVVDDGSVEKATDLLEGLEVAIETHGQNKGKGEAILTAGRVAAERGFTHVITLDADGQHAPEDLDRFKDAIDEEPDALYVGVRDFSVANVPGSSKFGRKFSNFWFRLQTGQSLSDCQSGYRAYPTPVLTEINYMFRTFAFEVEVLVRSAWAGLLCKDVPISVYYPPENERVSHFHKFRDNLRLSILNTHLTCRSITPWPHQKLSIGKHKTDVEKISMLHPFRSLTRLLRENASPYQLALSAFIGIFIGALPIFGAHTVAILFASTFFRANKPFAVSLSQLCMPPLMPALCIELGHYFRYGEWLTEISLKTLGYQALHRLWEWFLGSLILGPVAGLLAAGVVFVFASIVAKGLNSRKKDGSEAIQE